MKRVLFGVVLLCLCVFASSARADVSLQTVDTVSQAVYVTSPPNDSRLFIVTKDGKVYVKDGSAPKTLFFDISSLVSTDKDRGMLSIAFAEDYASSGHFYLNFNGVDGDGTAKHGDLHIDEFTDPNPSNDDATGATRRQLFTLPHDLDTSHNGGVIYISPWDHQLWVSVGDGGVGGDACHNAQTIDTVSGPVCKISDSLSVNRHPLLGKVLRVNPNAGSPYSTSPGQPFTAGGVTAQPEIFAYGLRNPFRWSFDKLTGDMIIGDVGENNYEEVDFVPRAQLKPGLNFGWNAFEGLHDFPGGATLFGNADTKPVYEYPHLDADNPPVSGCSVIGGYVVRDPTSSLYGQYIFGDYCEGKVRAGCVSASGMTDVRDLGILPAIHIFSFGEDSAGHIYVIRNGNVSKIVATGDEGSCPVPDDGGGVNGAGVKTIVPKPSQWISKVRFLTKQPVARRGYVAVTATCDTACSLTAKGTFRISGNKDTLRSRKLHRSLRKNKATKLKVRLSSSTRKALRLALLTGHKISVKVTLSVPGGPPVIAKLTVSG